MKKKLICLLLAAVLAVCCAPAAGAELPVTFTDDLGREVTVACAERVAILIGSFTHIWHLAGGTESIAAAANDSWTSFDIPISEDAVNLGSTMEISLEGILSADPDLVIASANSSGHLALRDSLEAMGIPTAFFQVTSFTDYLHMLEICAQITGKPENYEKYGASVLSQVEAARARNDGSKPTALFIRVSGAGCSVKNSENTVLGEMLKDLGAVNIADSETSLLENLSMEAIMQLDPDYIFVILHSNDPAVAQGILEQTLLSDPAWKSLTAVQEGRCHVMDPDLYNLKPNDRWGEAYENLAAILYPAQ